MNGVVRWERRRVTMLRARLMVSPDAGEELIDTSRGLEMLVSKVQAFSGHVEGLSQTGLDARARRRNVDGCFAVARGARVPETVWLVDDVVTTGATLGEAARVLRAAGARRVAAVCLARTPAPPR